MSTSQIALILSEECMNTLGCQQVWKRKSQQNPQAIFGLTINIVFHYKELYCIGV